MSRLLTLFGGDSGGWALKAVADLGYSVANPAAFGAWADAARSKTNSSTLMVFTNPSSTLLFEILLRAQTTGDKISVYWDDGSSNDYTLNNMAGADTAVGHTYAAAANRTVVVCGAERVRRVYSAQTDGRTAFGGNISSWTWLTYLNVSGSNTLSGSVAGLTDLTLLNVSGSNTLSGSVAALTDLTYLAVSGSNTLLGSVTGLTDLTYLAVSGSNTLSGSVAALTDLTVLHVYGNNTLSGSVAALTDLTYLNVYGNNTLTGFDGVASSATKLAYFKMNNVLSEAVVNAILAGFWANRDVPKTRAERTIDLNDNAGSAAPTGQGITDRDALRLYVSPPGATVWTVETN